MLTSTTDYYIINPVGGGRVRRGVTPGLQEPHVIFRRPRSPISPPPSLPRWKKACPHSGPHTSPILLQMDNMIDDFAPKVDNRQQLWCFGEIFWLSTLGL